MNKIIRQAFTLIELLVVIAIIGILSGLIVIGLNGMTQKANIAKAQIFSNSLKNSLMLNLVSEWKFDPTGTIVSDGQSATPVYTQDSWGGGNNGAVTTAPTVLSGSNCIAGSCLHFPGIIDCGNASNINLSNTNFTISAWIKLDNTTAKDIIKKTGTNYQGVAIYYQGRFSALYRNPAGTNFDVSAQNAAEADKWYLVTQTVNSTTNAIYINGALSGSTPLTSGLFSFSNDNLKFGEGIGLGGFSGALDEVRIYNVSLPASKIKEQYYAGLNNLLISSQISKEDYIQRIIENE